MTIDEARKIVDEAEFYFEDEGDPKRVCIDGWLTLEELEAVVILSRAALKGSDAQ